MNLGEKLLCPMNWYAKTYLIYLASSLVYRHFSSPQVFPPQFRELPPPALELFDLDEAFSSEKSRLAQITNKCKLFFHTLTTVLETTWHDLNAF